MPTFPHFRQLEAMDCGPACLKMICQFYKKNVSITELKEKTFFNTSGVTMLDLILAAESIGFSTLSVTLTLNQLVYKAILPCIVYYYNHHFIVVYKVSFKTDKTFIHIADPASGLQKQTLEEFQKGWLTHHKDDISRGHCLMLKPK